MNKYNTSGEIINTICLNLLVSSRFGKHYRSRTCLRISFRFHQLQICFTQAIAMIIISDTVSQHHPSPRATKAASPTTHEHDKEWRALEEATTVRGSRWGLYQLKCVWGVGSGDMTGQWDDCGTVNDYRVPFFPKEMASIVHSFPDGCGQQLDWLYLKKIIVLSVRCMADYFPNRNKMNLTLILFSSVKLIEEWTDTSPSLPTHFSMGLGFVWLLNALLFPKAFPEAIGNTFKDNEDDCQHDGQEEANHIQGVVLVPGEVMGSRTQVWCPLVPHHVLHPEHSQVQRLYGTVLVKSGEPHDVLLVTEHKAVVSLGTPT